MSIITPELVERATAVANDHEAVCADTWCAPEMMLVALTAILPDIIEACAKVADDLKGQFPGDGWTAASDIAEAIRALSPQSPPEFKA